MDIWNCTVLPRGCMLQSGFPVFLFFQNNHVFFLPAPEFFALFCQPLLLPFLHFHSVCFAARGYPEAVPQKSISVKIQVPCALAPDPLPASLPPQFFTGEALIPLSPH